MPWFLEVKFINITEQQAGSIEANLIVKAVRLAKSVGLQVSFPPSKSRLNPRIYQSQRRSKEVHF